MPLKVRNLAAKIGLPWWLRIAIKVVLGHVPLAHRHWKAIGMFEHGRMENADYARRVWDNHAGALVHCQGTPTKALLELGPGEGGFTIGNALAAGFETICLVDVQRLFEPAAYLTPEALALCGVTLPSEVARSRVRYQTEGLPCLCGLAGEAFDLVFSNTVLQHVRRAEVPAYLRELFRITRPGGVGSHRVDFRDMLGGSLNNLRIGSGLWERDWFARSGFYTNRLRHSELTGGFRAAGFEIIKDSVDLFDACPEAARHRCREFHGLTEEDLLVKGCNLVVRKPGLTPRTAGPAPSPPAAG